MEAPPGARLSARLLACAVLAACVLGMRRGVAATARHTSQSAAKTDGCGVAGASIRGQRQLSLPPLHGVAGDGAPRRSSSRRVWAEDHRDWAIVQPEIARTTRVCSYDRSGLGFSEDAPKRASARQKVSDLHALLAAAGVPGPYVLVGHSYGGMLTRACVRGHVARRRRRAGFARLFASPTRSAGSSPRSRRGAGVNPRRSPSFAKDSRSRAPTRRGSTEAKTSNQARAARPIGNKPVIVVTGREVDPTGLPGLPGIVPRFERAWLRMQDDLARLSPDSRTRHRRQQPTLRDVGSRPARARHPRSRRGRAGGAGPHRAPQLPRPLRASSRKVRGRSLTRAARPLTVTGELHSPRPAPTCRIATRRRRVVA